MIYALFSADFFRLRSRFCRLSVLLELKFHGRLSEYFFHLKYCIVFHKNSAGLVAVVTNICRPMPFNSPPSPLSFHCLSAPSLSVLLLIEKCRITGFYSSSPLVGIAHLLDPSSPFAELGPVLLSTVSVLIMRPDNVCTKAWTTGLHKKHCEREKKLIVAMVILCRA